MKHIITTLFTLTTITLSAQTINTLPAELASGHIITCLPDTIPNADIDCWQEIHGTLDEAATSLTIYYMIGKPCCFYNAVDPVCCNIDSTTAPSVFYTEQEVYEYIGETFVDPTCKAGYVIRIKNNFD